MTTGERRTVLAAGTFDEDVHPRARVLLEGLEAHGWEVERAVVPLGLDTAARVEMLQRPSHVGRLVVALVRAHARLVPRLLRRRSRADAVLVGHLGHFDVALVRLLARGAPVVLDFLVSGAGTARDRGERGRVKQRLLRALDAFALSRADVVVVDTPEHLATLPPRPRGRAVVAPVGADRRWFEAAREQGSDGGPLSVVFFGSFTPLQGATVVGEALRSLGGVVRATVVGQGQQSAEVDALLAGVPGVVRHTWVEADDLPALVASHDVCLGIFGTGDKALRVLPNKAFQGAAAGCVVVTEDSAPARRLLGPAGVLVPPGDAAALADALRRLDADRDLLRDLRRASLDHARAAFTPAGVVQDLVARLGAGA